MKKRLLLLLFDIRNYSIIYYKRSDKYKERKKKTNIFYSQQQNHLLFSDVLALLYLISF